jgi:MtN3 and saliva related transmembrane protein
MTIPGLTAFGIIGSVLLAIAVLPQFYRMLHTKSAHDISAYYILILAIGSFCLTVYGYGINDIIVIALNLFATVANASLLLLKAYYDNNEKKENRAPT